MSNPSFQNPDVDAGTPDPQTGIHFLDAGMFFVFFFSIMLYFIIITFAYEFVKGVFVEIFGTKELTIAHNAVIVLILTMILLLSIRFIFKRPVVGPF
jgi:hypothetical protein